MEIYGNATTFNLENVLRQNITACDYYRNDCTVLLNWQSVIDEIYNAVEHVEPWLGGNARSPSTAFCLLHRLFTLRMSVEEITATINHSDSPFIRAVGFLYLRYVCDPRNLWNWFSGYVEDKEVFKPSKLANHVTMGEYIRDLLLDQYYFETIFPRIPKKVQDDIIAALQARGLPTTAKGNGGTGGADRRGGDDANRRPASVKASLSVALGQKAPNRAGTKDYSLREALWEEKMGGGGTGGRGGSGNGAGRDRDREGRDRDREREREKEPDYRRDKDRHAGRERERGYEREHGHDRDWEYDRRGGDARDPYSRDRGKDWDRDERRGAERYGGSRERSPYGGREREPPRSPYERPRSRSRDRGRGGYSRRSPQRERAYSRSPDRRRDGGGGNGGGRNARDVFRESAAAGDYGGGGAGGDVRSRYGDASGSRLFEEASRGSRAARTGEEVYRLGDRRGGGYR